MNHAPADSIARLRAALGAPRVRALVIALGLAVAGAQLVLQAHVVAHDLTQKVGDACALCMAAKHSAALPSVAATPPIDSHPLAPDVAVAALLPAPAPLVIRSRGPPAVARVA